MAFSRIKKCDVKKLTENIGRVYYCNKFDPFRCLVWSGLATPLTVGDFFNDKHTNIGRFRANRLWEKLSIPNKISKHIPLAFLDTVFLTSRSVPFQRHQPLPTTYGGSACNQSIFFYSLTIYGSFLRDAVSNLMNSDKNFASIAKEVKKPW